MDLGTDTTLFDFEPEDIGAQIAVEDLRLLLKASFGGDRSAAGRYAAEQRWKNHQKKEDDATGRKGGGSLDDEIRRVSDVLTAVGNLPVKPDGDGVVELSDYENSRGSQFVDVVVKDKTFTVVSQAVIEAEQAVNALGKRVVTEISEKLVADGTITQKELDDAISFQGTKQDTQRPVDKLIAKAMRGDDDIPDELREAAIDVTNNKELAQQARSALIRATKTLNQMYEKVGRHTLTPELRTAFDLRQAAQKESTLARFRLGLAEEILMSRASELVAPSDADTQDTKILIANSVRVQGLIGEQVQALLTRERAMGTKIPTGKVAGLVGRQQQTDNIMATVAGRYPEALLALSKNVDIKFTQSAGGSYSPSRHKIEADAEDADTLTHEMVHSTSFFSAQTRLVEQAALQRRIFGKADDGDLPFGQKLAKGMQKSLGAEKALGRNFGGGRYVEDKFVDGYQGRIDYNSEQSGGYRFTSATEVLSVATETVFGGSKFRITGRMDRDLSHTAVGWLLTAEGGK